MAVSQEHQRLVQAATEAFGGEPALAEHHDQSGTHSITILSVPDSPLPPVTSYATVGLSDHTLEFFDEKPLRIELVGAAYQGSLDLPKLLATCAFNVIEDGSAGQPGAILRDVHAVPREWPAGLPFFLDEQTLLNGDDFTFDTDFGAFDILGAPGVLVVTRTS